MTTEGFTPAKYAFVIREVRKAQHEAWQEGYAAGRGDGYDDAHDIEYTETENPYPEEP